MPAGLPSEIIGRYQARKKAMQASTARVAEKRAVLEVARTTSLSRHTVARLRCEE
ncbi:MAG: hypothetical protein OXB98_02050 [Bryobacterales bacterium]|nr:hypothetical protein [Bryobacterales bacterium]